MRAALVLEIQRTRITPATKVVPLRPTIPGIRVWENCCRVRAMPLVAPDCSRPKGRRRNSACGNLFVSPRRAGRVIGGHQERKRSRVPTCGAGSSSRRGGETRRFFGARSNIRQRPSTQDRVPNFATERTLRIPAGSRYREESPDQVSQSASRVPAHPSGGVTSTSTSRTRFVRASPGRNRGRPPKIGTRVSFEGASRLPSR